MNHISPESPKNNSRNNREQPRELFISKLQILAWIIGFIALAVLIFGIIRALMK